MPCGGQSLYFWYLNAMVLVLFYSFGWSRKQIVHLTIFYLQVLFKDAARPKLGGHEFDLNWPKHFILLIESPCTWCFYSGVHRGPRFQYLASEKTTTMNCLTVPQRCQNDCKQNAKVFVLHFHTYIGYCSSIVVLIMGFCTRFKPILHIIWHENSIFVEPRGTWSCIRVYGETLQGVLGSGENGVQNYREQGAWGQKDQGAGSKGK